MQDMQNPYLEEFIQCNGADMFSSMDDRTELTNRYSFSVPTEEALEEIKGFSTSIVEIGAGGGYWAGLLLEMGVDIIAFDNHSWAREKMRFAVSVGKWFDVEKADLEVITEHSNRTLMLSWPPYNDPMAADTLKAYMRAGGTKLVYIGENINGCTGDELFHRILHKFWNLDKYVEIPQWGGIHDAVMLYSRRLK